MADPALTATCRCGQVRIVVDGAPILSAVCHCDDCQAAAKVIEALPGAPRITDAYGGTGLTLVRPDRMRVVAGAELLKPYKLRPDSPTNRRVASCCNTLMSLDFDRGPFWASVLTQQFEPPKPQATVRVQTKHVPSGTDLPDDLPTSKGYAPLQFLSILAAGAAMLKDRAFSKRGM